MDDTRIFERRVKVTNEGVSKLFYIRVLLREFRAHRVRQPSSLVATSLSGTLLSGSVGNFMNGY